MNLQSEGKRCVGEGCLATTGRASLGRVLTTLQPTEKRVVPSSTTPESKTWRPEMSPTRRGSGPVKPLPSGEDRTRTPGEVTSCVPRLTNNLKLTKLVQKRGREGTKSPLHKRVAENFRRHHDPRESGYRVKKKNPRPEPLLPNGRSRGGSSPEVEAEGEGDPGKRGKSASQTFRGAAKVHRASTPPEAAPGTTRCGGPTLRQETIKRSGSAQ